MIGGGSAGYAAARTGVEEGLKTVVIDGANELGGLCILRGCMPSKTLIESANRNLAIREAEKFGIQVGRSEVMVDQVVQRKRELIGEFRDYRTEQLQDGRFDLIRGTASFRDATHLQIELLDEGALEVEASAVIIATGSHLFVPEIEGLSETGYLTSDDVLDREEAPESLIVLGGGAIALEMAHYYEAIGRKVTVIQRSDHLLSGMDHDVADELETALTGRGLEIFCGTEIQRISTTPGGEKAVFFQHRGEEKKVVASEILCALGRRPSTESLNCEEAGVFLRKGKVVVNPAMQSQVDHIFAAGDVASPYEIVHLAIEQGEMAARNAARILNNQGDLEQMDYRLKLYGIFTEPEVASVGLTELEAKEQDRSVLVETYPFNDHGKSMVHGSEHGFVKLIADSESRLILGAAVIGPACDGADS